MRPEQRSTATRRVVGIVAVVLVAAGLATYLVTRAGDDRVAIADTTTTTPVVLPPSDPDAPGEQADLSAPGAVRRYVARLDGSGAPLSPDVAAAAEALLGRRLELLVECASCVMANADGSLAVEVSTGGDSPDPDRIEGALTSLDEVVAAPVTESTPAGPCAAPLVADTEGGCVGFRALTTLRVGHVELGGPRPDGERSVTATLDESSVAAQANLDAACSQRSATCPTGRLVLVRGNQVLAELTGRTSSSDLPLGRRPAPDARLLAAGLLGDPALDGWTISLDRTG